MRRRLSVLFLLFLLGPIASHATAATQPTGRQPEQQDGFEPMSEVPPEDQLPAAPLLIAAYAFVWVAVLFYIVSLARRLATVQGELLRLERSIKDSRQG